ncbi:MAG: hypothetical protein DRJ65_08720 [Acidobacteria bacterium]|nr:MAG: hypothetical protein DRJ65_08720 [Acidobacteriota bacterium]
MVRDNPGQALPLLRALSTAVNYRALYPQSHPKVIEGVGAVVGCLHTFLKERGCDSMTVLVIDNELLVDDRPIRSGHLYLGPLIRTMSRLGIERLTLAGGLDLEECHGLIEGLASIGEPGSTQHVILGRVQLNPSEGGTGTGGSARGSQFSEHDIDMAQEGFLRYREDRSGSVGQLDRMLWHFVEGMDQNSRSLLLLGPMKNLDQRLFVHAINVAMLVVAQARSLGITGQSLQTIGLAALLHDIGKLSLPLALLDRDGDLSDVEWEILKMHTVLGAAQLCGLPEAPPLAVLVAYEHHLRWDGKPSYPVSSVPRRPNLASQLTAIADTYDVMVESRGFKGGVHGEVATRVWRDRSETYLDPFLVGNFVLMIAGAEQETEN